MKTKKDKGDKHPLFVPLFRGTSESPAYRQLSFASRALFMALCGRCGKNSNGHVYLSQRDVGEELGHQNRNDIANWYRELVHYGFLVQTEAASLGVDGKGKAPHWRITDRPTRTATASSPRPPRSSCAGMGWCSNRMLHRPGGGTLARRRPSKNKTPDCTSVPQWTARPYQRRTARPYHPRTKVVPTGSPYRCIRVVPTGSP